MNEVTAAIASVPSGAWAVGVSGGADSMALLALLRERADLRLCVAHLDHETRGGASAEDARFAMLVLGRVPFPRRRELQQGLVGSVSAENEPYLHSSFQQGSPPPRLPIDRYLRRR